MILPYVLHTTSLCFSLYCLLNYVVPDGRPVVGLTVSIFFFMYRAPVIRPSAVNSYISPELHGIKYKY